VTFLICQFSCRFDLHPGKWRKHPTIMHLDMFELSVSHQGPAAVGKRWNRSLSNRNSFLLLEPAKARAFKLRTGSGSVDP